MRNWRSTANCRTAQLLCAVFAFTIFVFVVPSATWAQWTQSATDRSTAHDSRVRVAQNSTGQSSVQGQGVVTLCPPALNDPAQIQINPHWVSLPTTSPPPRAASADVVTSALNAAVARRNDPAPPPVFDAPVQRASSPARAPESYSMPRQGLHPSQQGGHPSHRVPRADQANQASRLLSGRAPRQSLHVAQEDVAAAKHDVQEDTLPAPLGESKPKTNDDDPPAPPAPPSAPNEPLEDLMDADDSDETGDSAAEAAGDFPSLPPDPEEQDEEKKLEPLPDMHEEIYHHGGSYLYAPEGDRLGWPEHGSGEHYEVARLPEDYVAPEPFTLFADFLGADPIRPSRHVKLPGHGAYGVEPRFVGYGSYSLFHSYFVQNGTERHLVGHNANIELDLRLTGTERFHVQFRPFGEGNTGGSFFSIEPDDGYIDNSTITPTRYWVEGSLDSLFGAYHDGFSAIDYNFVVGKFPLQLQNNLLINDEIIGAAVAKNTIYLGDFSNINAQVFYGFNDVDVSPVGDGELIGGHLKLEYRYWYLEGSYAHVNHDFDATQDADWAALSMTRYYGPWTLTGRGLFKWGDEGGSGSGNLFTMEANRLVYFDHGPFGAEHAVVFANAFSASEGWESIANANLNRIRTAFAVNPLTQIAAGAPLLADTAGISVGAQFFFDHDNQSLTPEFAFEVPGGDAVWGYGVRYLRKVGEQAFLEVLSLGNFSDNDRFDRAGVFSQFTILF